MEKNSDLKSWVGSSLKLTFDIEKNQVTRFMRAIGDLSESCTTAPITFLSTFYPLHSWLESLGLNMHAVMHAEETYEYFKPVSVGDTIDVEHTIAEAYVKSAGDNQLKFVVIETTGFIKKDAMFKGKRVLVERRSA